MLNGAYKPLLCADGTSGARRFGNGFRCAPAKEKGKELFALAATVSRTQAMVKAGDADARNAVKMTDLFCRNSRRRIDRLFKELWNNDDVLKYSVSRTVLNGDQQWIESGIVAAPTRPVPVPNAKPEKISTAS